MRALLVFLVASCGGASTPAPAAPANRGGTEPAPPPNELRLDADNLPHDYQIDPPAPIELVVTSKIVSAEVHVDGVAVGVTPVRVHVSAGHHAIRVYAEGY